MSVMRACWHACMQRAVQRVMKRDMSDAPLHIVFSLFDANRDGNLASGELVAVGKCSPPCDLLHAVPCCFLSVITL